jgi:hypothetical protein
MLKKNFIELKTTGETKTINLQYLKIVGITFDSIYQKPTIEMLIILHNFKTNEDGYFTVGGEQAENVDLKVNEIRAGYMRMIRFSKDNSIIRSMKMDHFKLPYGILLVYDNFNSIKFDSKPVLIDSNLEKAIIDGLIDLVVFRAEMTGITSYSFFEKIHEPYKNTQYVLKGFGILQSLSRCDNTQEDSVSNFRPDLFKISEPSPGLENICDRSSYLLKLRTTNIQIADPQVESDMEQENESQETIEQKELELEEIYEGIPTCSMSDTQSVKITNILREEKLETNDSKVEEWDSTCFFQNRWINLINDNQRDLISTETIKRPEIKRWFQYNYNENHPRNSTYSCRLCLKYAPELYKSHQQIPNIAKPKGHLIKDRVDSKKRNNEYIRNHDKSTTHSDVIKFLKRRKRDSMPELILQMQKKKDLEQNDELKVTARLMRTVYVEILADVAFNQHQRFVNLQRIHNIDMGYHHDNKDGAIRMLRCISDTMHTDLITEVNVPNLPISLIVDTTPDSTKNHFMIAYFFFLRNNNPIVQLYRLINIGFSEDSESLYNLLIDAFRNDKIEGYLRRNMVAFISDG